MSLETKYNKLISVIEGVGEQAREYFYNEDQYSSKEDRSLVTKIDLEGEAAIREFIKAEFPDDTIVGEESDDKEGSSGYIWYIDPIDGTENFVRKIPLFSITATRLGPDPEGSMAVIHNPVSRQTYASFKEDGVYENRHLSKRPAGVTGSRRAIHVMSSNYDTWVKPAKHHLVHQLGKKYGRSASFSCGLLEMAYVAVGRLDGVLCLYNKAWDTAAGLYLNKAAGNQISVFKDSKWQEYQGAIKDLYGESHRDQSTVLASKSEIHEELVELIGDPKQWADQ